MKCWYRGCPYQWFINNFINKIYSATLPGPLQTSLVPPPTLPSPHSCCIIFKTVLTERKQLQIRSRGSCAPNQFSLLVMLSFLIHLMGSRLDGRSAHLRRLPCRNNHPEDTFSVVFPFQPVPYDWNVKWCDVCCPVYERVGVRCSSLVRAFVHGAMGRRIDPSWWTHWVISRSSK